MTILVLCYIKGVCDRNILAFPIIGCNYLNINLNKRKIIVFGITKVIRYFTLAQNGYKCNFEIFNWIQDQVEIPTTSQSHLKHMTFDRH